MPRKPAPAAAPRRTLLPVCARSVHRVSTTERYQLAVFLVGSVALASLATWVLAGLPVSPVISSVVALPISYIPAVLAGLVLRTGGDADDRRAFRRRLARWRIGLR
jgi:hypothetical protein